VATLATVFFLGCLILGGAAGRKKGVLCSGAPVSEGTLTSTRREAAIPRACARGSMQTVLRSIS